MLFSKFIDMLLMGLSNMTRLPKCLSEFFTNKIYFIARFADGVFLLTSILHKGKLRYGKINVKYLQ